MRNWTYKGISSPAFSLAQVFGLPRPPSMDGEPALIRGLPALRSLTSVPGSQRPPNLIYLWQDGRVSYILTGTLAEPLTEDALIRVAESIR